MKIDPYYQQLKCRPMTLVSGNIRHMADIRGSSPGRWCQMTVGLSTMAIFGDLGGFILGNVRDKTSNITWRYATPCRPVIDCKMNDLERLFHVEIRFRPSRLSRAYLCDS